MLCIGTARAGRATAMPRSVAPRSFILFTCDNAIITAMANAKNASSSGFTIIEVMIVIFILGVLAVTIIGNINTARDNGRDASIRQNLSNIRTQAQVYYEDNLNYGDILSGTCNTGMFSNSVVQAMITEALLRSDDTSARCTSDNDDGTADEAWSIELVLSNGGYWCVDSGYGAGYSSDQDADAGRCDYSD